MARQFYVYCLFRPTGEPFYIGKGKGKRLLDHEKPCRSDGSHKANIIRQARRLGLEIPKIIIRDGLSEIEAFDLERALIAALGRFPNGCLANATDGGEGVAGHRHSEASKAKMAAAKLGRPSPRRGARHSEETKTKLRLAKLGRPSPNKGIKLSDQQKEKLRQAHFGKQLSDDHRSKISAGLLRNSPNKGKTFSAEYREKLRVAQLKLHINKGQNDAHRP